jgi:nicotinamidase-related amidase
MSKLQFVTRLDDHEFKAVDVEGSEVALILIDLWEKHWCSTMEIRSAILAKKVNQLLPAMRKNGICIIHAPSLRDPPAYLAGSGKFYEKEQNDKNGFQRRQAFLGGPAASGKKISDLPTDDKLSQIWWNEKKDRPYPGLQLWVYPLRQDGCDGINRGCGPNEHWPPYRQHPSIQIDNPDIVANENESYRILMFLRSRNIKHLVYAGVATNECVIHSRNTSIYYMQQLVAAFSGPEIKFYLARDLTDTMYKTPPNAPQYEVHDSGTAATVTWIERNLQVASILSSDLVSL